MDSIVLRLSEIEDAAQAILKDTETKKERLNRNLKNAKTAMIRNRRLWSIRGFLPSALLWKIKRSRS